MKDITFTNIRVCVFDAYGTLFDVHSAAAKYSIILGQLEAPVSELWRSKQLQYTWLRSLMGNYADFWTVTGEALDYAMDTYAVTDLELREQLMNAYLHLHCFEEVETVLRTLKENGIATAVLSNGSPNMLDPVVVNSGISEYVDANISVDEVGVYKPAPEVYQLACDRFDVNADEVSFQSSNCWDAIGAAQFGFQVAWCNRYKQKLDLLSVSPKAEIQNLRELLPLLGLE